MNSARTGLIADPDLVAAFGVDIEDPWWRLNNLYTIVDKTGKKVRFVPNVEQTTFIKGLHWRNLVLKARQLGITTVSCLLYLDDCLFNENISAAVIAHRLDDAGEIFRTKVKGPYDDLPEIIRSKVALITDNESTLEFDNGSKIRVSTSTRSGTVQWLHVSEYGKICAQFPEKAREIRTGAFPSAELGVITIESTAEGESGDFFEKAQIAEQVATTGRPLERLDYKFFFFPWIGRAEYRLRQPIAGESPEDTRYFNRLEATLKVRIEQEQRNWWLAKEREIGGDMKREFPATPQEAFEVAIEGAYFLEQLAFLERNQRIGHFPIDPALRVHTAWDIGKNDKTCIWLWQDRDGLQVFVGFYENSGEWVSHYIDWLSGWAKDHGVMFGEHYLPHDGKVSNFWMPGGSTDVMQSLGFFPNIVPRGSNKIEIINAARRKMALMAFDRDACKVGLSYLRRYRKELDANGVFKNTPLHDDASHAADALMTMTQSGHVPTPEDPTPRGVDRYRRPKSRPTGSPMAA